MSPFINLKTIPLPEPERIGSDVKHLDSSELHTQQRHQKDDPLVLASIPPWPVPCFTQLVLFCLLNALRTWVDTLPHMTPQDRAQLLRCTN